VIKLGIVGAGIMGSHHARVARALTGAQIAVIVDPDSTKGERLAAHVGAVYAPDLDSLIGRADAAIVTAPTELHADIGLSLLENRIDVLVEKPITSTLEEAKALVAAADQHDRILMVGHVERFNPAFMELRRHVDGLVHIDVRRVGPYTPRISTGVVLDLMIHDIDLVAALTASEPVEVSALTRRVRSTSEDIASCLLTFANGVSATITASRVSQTKQRQIELTQQDNVVVADLIRQQVTVHRVEHAEYVDGQGARYRQSGVIEIPYLENQGEPLALEQRHFIECVTTRSQPDVGGHEGLKALGTAIRIRDEAICLG
jgi:UDP-N-acetylglucosamine 3-dehydrogenase